MKSMMLVIFLALGAVASASQAWTPGREFVYEYKTRTMTGIPHLKNQFSGMGIRSKVIVQVKSENELYVKLAEVSVARAVNQEKSESYESWRQEMELQYSPLESKQGLSVPFKVNLREGRVESIETSAEEPIWVVNIKRALATQLSLNMNKIQRQRIFTAENEIGKSSEEFFAVEEEPSVTGECMTHYTIVPLPEYIAQSQEHQLEEELKKKNQERPAWIITKTRDFNACSKKPAFVHSSDVDEEGKRSSAADSQHKGFSSRTSVSRYLVRGEPMHRFIVERVWTEGEYIVRPFSTNTESIFLVSNQTLALKKEEPVSSSLSIPSQLVRKSLLFQLVPRNEQEEDELREQNFQRYNDEQESEYEEMQSDFGGRSWESKQKHQQQQHQRHYRDENQFGRYQSYEKQFNSRQHQRISPESYEYPKLTKAPQMMYVSGQPVPVQEVKQQIRQLTQKVEEQVESLQELEKEALPMTVLEISRALSTLDLEDIKEIYGEIVQENKFQQEANKAEKTKKAVLLDAIAMCGTNPCVVFLKQLIESRQVRGEQAAGLLMVLPVTVKTPTRELLEELVKLAKSVKSHSEQNEQVWFTALLSTSTLINRACVNSQSRRENYAVSPITKRPYCTAADAELLLPYLQEELKETTKTSRVIVLIQAIGNLGSYESFKVLRQVVTGQMHSEKQIRAKAIFALARIADEAPYHIRREIQALLQPIYSSPVEEEEVRMSAFVALIATQPEENFYTEAATSTWFEPNQQVGQFIYSTLENMANCTYPSHRNESQKAAMALPLAKRFNLGLQYSANSIFSHVIPERHIGSTLQLVRFGGKHSLFPEQIYIELKNIMGGFDSPAFRSSFQSQGIQSFFNRFLGPQEQEHLDTGLNIHTRKDNEFQGNLWIQMMGTMERVITLDTLLQWAKEGIVEYSGDNEYSINYQKTIPLEDANVVLPIDSGLPIYVSRKTPMFISLRGSVAFDMNVKNLNALKSELPSEAKIVLRLKPIISMTRLVEAGISSPLTKEVFLSGHKTNAHLNLPGKLEIALKDNQLDIVAERLQNLPSKLELLSYRSYPYTAQTEIYNFMKKNYKHIRVQHELKEMKMNFGQETLGLKFELSGKVDAPWMTYGGLYERLRHYNPLTVFTYIFVRDHTLREPEYKVYLDLSQSETQRVKLRLSYNKEHKNVSFRKFNEEERLLNKYYKEKSHKFQEMNQEFGRLWKNPQQLNQEEREGQAYNIRSSEERRRMEKYEQELETEPSAVVRSLHAEISCEGRENRRLRSSSIWTSSADSLKQKMSFIFEREASSTNSSYKVQACAHLQYPRLPNRRNEIYQSPKTTVGHVGVKYGSQNQEHEINARVVLDQTQEWLREIERNAISKECSRYEQEGAPYAPVCLHARREATALNKAVVKIEARNACKRFLNATKHIDDYLKAKYYPYMTNKQIEIQNPEKEIKMVFDIKPMQSHGQSWLVLDSYFFKPRENTFYQKVKFSQPYEYILPINAETSLSIRALNKALGYQYIPACEIQRELITTFDNVTYQYPLDECYHLVAKDCSKKIPVQVLAKQVTGGKWIKLQAGKIQVEISPELEVEYNGQKIRPSLNQEEVVRNSEGEKYLVVRLIKEGKLVVSAPAHGVKILADGKNFQVQMSNMFRGRVCGLCGDMNGEKVAELKDPQGCIRSSVKEFAESYTTGSCSHRQSRPVEESKCIREYTAVPASLSLRSSNWESRRSSSGIKYTNKVIPRESETCFSIKPITECPVGTKPTGQVTKKIAFHCVPRGRVANEMIARSRSGVLEELFSKSEDFSEFVSMPEACENIRSSSSSRGYGHRAI